MSLKEQEILCPYCHKEITECIEKNTYRCSFCKRVIRLSQIQCPSCFSPVIKVSLLLFCTNPDCPTYLDVLPCPFVEKCRYLTYGITCNHYLIKLASLKMGVMLYNKYVNLVTGCITDSLEQLPQCRNFLPMELSFHPALHDIYQRFKNLKTA